jgi:hypothetical protein
MEETQKPLGVMTAAEFQQFAEDILLAPELPPEAFFTALAALNEEAEEPQTPPLELSATVKDGKLSFLKPAPLFVRANELRLGSQRVIIHLVPETVARL